MAPLEYTLTITLPCGSSTKPVDCRYSGSSLTNAPVSPATARASALCPTGKVRPCLAISSAVVGSSSTDRAATLTPAPARLSLARWKARSCALQYGHQDPRKNSTTLKSPANLSGTVTAAAPGGVSDRAGNAAPGASSGMTVLLVMAG